MLRTTFALLAIAALPSVAVAQADTTRKRDTTRAPQSPDSTRRVRTEARGQVDLTSATERFRANAPNLGLTPVQAAELQQALARVGCNAGTADGLVGPQTLRGIECLRAQQKLSPGDLESVMTALNLSFARPATPPPVLDSAPPPRRDPPALPPVIRQDSTYRPDVVARRDSVRRDSVRRDSLRRDSTARRDTTRRPDRRE